HHQHRDGREGADRPQHLQPIPFGEHHIEQHRVGAIGPKPRHCLVAVGGCHHRESGISQRHPGGLPDRAVVFNHQDESMHATSVCCAVRSAVLLVGRLRGRLRLPDPVPFAPLPCSGPCPEQTPVARPSQLQRIRVELCPPRSGGRSLPPELAEAGGRGPAVGNGFTRPSGPPPTRSDNSPTATGGGSLPTSFRSEGQSPKDIPPDCYRPRVATLVWLSTSDSRPAPTAAPPSSARLPAGWLERRTIIGMTTAAVLFGGPSDEHDISILTGLQVARAPPGDPPALYWSKAGEWFRVDADAEAADFVDGVPRKAREVGFVAAPGGGFIVKRKPIPLDVAVIACHGGPGEDGTLQ